ncbi:hypothetical protein GP486_007637 [Trichoglossum hirsutum]|uniref:Proteasome inhibitor PI31 subunit n=1 Tax=Trichoglossum hirsutum TaxID=265104 RepID=A0A9P8IFH0_9PEZI|nr:hypothetical protein GP486_007637 [Trichoglossum hirsutum]
MASNPLSPSSLASTMVSSLPRAATTSVKNEYEAVALFSHACMVAVGFRLIGLGEEDRIAAAAAAAVESSSSEEGRHEPTSIPLPLEWNVSPAYAFRYTHVQSAMEYLVKVNRLGSRAVIFGIGIGDDKTASFDVPVQDYLSGSSFPVSVDATATEHPSSREELERMLQNAFISQARSADLATLFKVNVIQRLMPGLRKEGYEESSSSTPSTAAATTGPSATSPGQHRRTPPPRGPQHGDHNPLRDDSSHLPRPARPYPFHDPVADPPRDRPVPPGDLAPPGFEDEYEIGQPPRGYMPGLGGGEVGGRNPSSIGDGDLYPPRLGPHDPLRGYLGGGGLGRGGGMHPTFDDPLFGGRGGQQEYDPR